MAANQWGVDLAAYVTSQMQASAPKGWSDQILSPGNLSVPQAFITPEQVAQRAKEAGPNEVKTFSIEDFMTQPVALNDPKLASRPYTSTPQVPKTVGATVSAYSNVPVPAFLQGAINQLNQTQSLRAMEQADFRQQLLDATLEGNYLAAEALRASAVSPGASVGFGSAVLDPNIGYSAVIQGNAAAAESSARRAALTEATTQESSLRNQLSKVQGELSRLPSQTFGFSPIGISSSQGQQRAQLQSEQRRIQQELDRQRDRLAAGGAYRPSGFASPPVVIGL